MHVQLSSAVTVGQDEYVPRSLKSSVLADEYANPKLWTSMVSDRDSIAKSRTTRANNTLAEAYNLAPGRQLAPLYVAFRYDHQHR